MTEFLSEDAMKTCSKCDVTKAADAFYERSARCKECTKAAVRANYRTNRAHYVDYDRRREKTAPRRAAKSAAARLYKERNPLKRKARVMVGNAIRGGRLIRRPCKCGAEKVHAHHHDYSKPLEVEWLCIRCHWEHHGGVEELAAN
jgi:hypothetical protein